MYKPVYNIRIGDVSFSRLVEVRIEKSVKEFGNRAVIKLPQSAVLKHKDSENAGIVEVAKVFNVGDAVTISLGYEDELVQEEFVGFVESIGHANPVVISCLDNAYLLKNKNFKKSWTSVTVKELLTYVLKDFNLTLNTADLPDLTFSPMNINADGYEVVSKIISEYGLDCYFEGDVLYCHLPYLRNNGSVKYYLSGDNANTANLNRLEYMTEAMRNIKLKVVNIKKDGSKLTKEVGDLDGSLRTLNFYNLPDSTNLVELGEAELKKMKFDGYEGEIAAFFIPDCQPAMTATLVDPTYEREGNYYVEAVEIVGGDNGLMRIVNISVKL